VQSLPNTFQNHFGVIQYLIVPEANDLNTLLVEPDGSLFIGGPVLFKIMLVTIQFNGQTGRRAKKTST
jgi:hypothetical protein